MDLHGYNFTGDPDGLEYLISKGEALRELVSVVKARGQASFFYKEFHFIVIPTALGGYIVSKTERKPGFLKRHFNKYL